MNRSALWIALFVSLALNLFGAGLLVGTRLHALRAPTQAMQDLRPGNPLQAAVRDLPPEAQAAWRAQIPAFAASNGPKVREARRLVRETWRSLGTEPFDPKAAEAALAQARALEHDSRVAMDRRLVAFAATLSPADRARLGEALARPRGPVRGGQNRDGR